MTIICKKCRRPFECFNCGSTDLKLENNVFHCNKCKETWADMIISIATVKQD